MINRLHYPFLAFFAFLCLCVPLTAVQVDYEPSSDYGASTGEQAPDGTWPICDLPKSLRKKNISSKGLGCCVFRSLDHASQWQEVPALEGFPEWMVQNGIAGGGYPTKVDDLIPRISKSRSLPTPDYIQVENNDLEIIKLACKTGRMVCVTYSYSPTGRYNRQKIAHMVNVVHADDKYFAILDNNYISELEWLTPQEFLPVYSGGRTGWSVILLDYPPPPVPKNKVQ